MHPRSLRRALLPVALAATLLPAAAAHATPPGANGPLFALRSESSDYAMLDATKGIDDNIGAPTFAGGAMIGALHSSPDGDHVAYVSADDAGRIAVADAADAGHLHLLGGTTGTHGLAFSPDGNTIAFTADNKVFTVAADGSRAPQQLGDTLQGAWELDWGSNDGGLVVSADGLGMGENDLYAINLQTGAATRLTRTTGESETAMSFAPDGEKLVVASDPVGAGANHLDILGANGSGRHALVTESGVDTPAWSPDGTRIGFLTASGADGEDIATVKPDGSDRHAVASTGAAVGVTWPIKAGTGNKIPAADFTYSPSQPYTTGDTTLTSTATDPDGTIASQAWDLDGDGQYDDATAAIAHTTFTTAGAHRIGLKVKDDRGSTAVATKTINVLVGGTPGASFTVDPANPTVGEAATFTAAANDDPHAHVVHTQWDFDGDGTWDIDTGATRTVQHTYTSTGTVTAKLRVTDAEGDSDTKSITFAVKDLEHCGREQVGRLALDGCLQVKGTRRIAPHGVTVNGFRIDATDGAIPAFDVAQYRAAAVPAAQAKAVLDGTAAIPDTGESVPVASSCGEAVGTSRFALNGFKDDDKSAPFTLADGLTFAGMRARDNGDLRFGDGTAQFTFAGLFPRLLLNWTAEGRGTYAVAPECKDNTLTVRLGSFVSRIIQFPEIRLTRTGTNRWDGTVDMTLKGFKTFSATVTAIDGSVRSMQLNIGDAPVLPGAMVHAGTVTLRLDRGSEELVGHGSITSTPRLFGRDFLAVEGSLSLGRYGLKTYGMARIAGIDVGWLTAEVNPLEGYADLDAEFDMNLGPAHVEGELSGYLEPLKFRAEIYGSARARIKGIGSIGADALVSTRGIAACGHISFGVIGSASPGFSYRYGDSLPKVFLSSCDFGDLRVPRASGAAAGGSRRVRSVTVPSGQRAVVIVARGPRAGRAPRVALVGPHGQRITSKANGQATKSGRFLVIPNKQDGTTNIMVMKPAAGTWRVKPLSGTTVKQVGTAAALPAVSVKAKYDKKRNAISWTLRAIAKQSVRFVEVHADGTTRVLKTTNKRKGTFKYTPAAGTTQIVAEVTQNGLMRARKVMVKKVVR